MNLNNIKPPSRQPEKRANNFGWSQAFTEQPEEVSMAAYAQQIQHQLSSARNPEEVSMAAYAQQIQHHPSSARNPLKECLTSPGYAVLQQIAAAKIENAKQNVTFPPTDLDTLLGFLTFSIMRETLNDFFVTAASVANGERE